MSQEDTDPLRIDSFYMDRPMVWRGPINTNDLWTRPIGRDGDGSKSMIESQPAVQTPQKQFLRVTGTNLTGQVRQGQMWPNVTRPEPACRNQGRTIVSDSSWKTQPSMPQMIWKVPSSSVMIRKSSSYTGKPLADEKIDERSSTACIDKPGLSGVKRSLISSDHCLTKRSSTCIETGWKETNIEDTYAQVDAATMTERTSEVEWPVPIDTDVCKDEPEDLKPDIMEIIPKSPINQESLQVLDRIQLPKITEVRSLATSTVWKTTDNESAWKAMMKEEAMKASTNEKVWKPTIFDEVIKPTVCNEIRKSRSFEETKKLTTNEDVRRAPMNQQTCKAPVAEEKDLERSKLKNSTMPKVPINSDVWLPPTKIKVRDVPLVANFKAPSKKGEIKAPDNVEINAPKNIETKALQNVEIKTQKNVELKAPQNVEMKTPNNVEMKTPKNVEMKTPKNVEMKTPKNVEMKTPKNVEVKAPQNVKVKAPQNVEEKALQNVEVKAPENVEVKAPQNVEVKGSQNVEVKAPQNIEIKAPENFEEKASQNVQIKSPENVEIDTPNNVEMNAPKRGRKRKTLPNVEDSKNVNERKHITGKEIYSFKNKYIKRNLHKMIERFPDSLKSIIKNELDKQINQILVNRPEEVIKGQNGWLMTTPPLNFDSSSSLYLLLAPDTVESKPLTLPSVHSQEGNLTSIQGASTGCPSNRLQMETSCPDHLPSSAWINTNQLLTSLPVHQPSGDWASNDQFPSTNPDHLISGISSNKGQLAPSHLDHQPSEASTDTYQLTTLHPVHRPLGTWASNDQFSSTNPDHLISGVLTNKGQLASSCLDHQPSGVQINTDRLAASHLDHQQSGVQINTDRLVASRLDHQQSEVRTNTDRFAMSRPVHQSTEALSNKDQRTSSRALINKDQLALLHPNNLPLGAWSNTNQEISALGSPPLKRQFAAYPAVNEASSVKHQLLTMGNKSISLNLVQPSSQIILSNIKQAPVIHQSPSPLVEVESLYIIPPAEISDADTVSGDEEVHKVKPKKICKMNVAKWSKEMHKNFVEVIRSEGSKKKSKVEEKSYKEEKKRNQLKKDDEVYNKENKEEKKAMITREGLKVFEEVNKLKKVTSKIYEGVKKYKKESTKVDENLKKSKEVTMKVYEDVRKFKKESIKVDENLKKSKEERMKVYKDVEKSKKEICNIKDEKSINEITTDEYDEEKTRKVTEEAIKSDLKCLKMLKRTFESFVKLERDPYLDEISIKMNPKKQDNIFVKIPLASTAAPEKV